MSKEASVLSRLGEPDQIADAAVTAYQRRTFFGRHPSAKFWVFGVSPIAAMPLGFILACLGVALFSTICGKCGVQLTDSRYLGRIDPTVLDWAFSIVTTVVPAAGLTFLYCRFARRLEIGRKWMLASCGVLAAVAMLPMQTITLSDMPGKSLWTIALAFPPDLLQCVQLLVPLALGLAFLRRDGRQWPREDRPSESGMTGAF